MSYQGGRLKDLVDRVNDAVSPAMAIMADDNGKNMTQWVVKNTPIERFVKDVGGTHLRDQIFQKDLIVYVDAQGNTVYETGSYTEKDYAPHVEEGTGEYGPSGKPYEIKPKQPGGVLKFLNRSTGQYVFAKKVMHPGSPGQHMFAIGAQMTEHEFERTCARGLREFERIAETGRPSLRSAPIPVAA